MKKFFTITLLTLAMMFFVACGGGSSKGSNSTEPTDEPTNPTDEPTNPTDEPTNPTDEPTNPTDEPTNPTDEPTNPTDDPTTPANCTGLSVDWSTLTMYQSNFFYLGDDPAVYMEFYQNSEGTVAAGTYNLGTGDNANYQTCTECVRYLTDYVEDEGYAHQYFQKSGTLKIDGVDDYGNIKGTIAATLIEVTINSDTYESTPVAGGACFEIETANFDSGYEEPCVPECNGKQCGSDGCGGSCGTCEGQACSADFQCVPFNCESLEFDEVKLATVSNWSGTYKRYEAYVKNNAAGDTNVPDLLMMTFYTYDAEEDEWSYRTELLEGSETLASFEEDETTVLLYEDYNVEEETVGGYFVQESGTLNFTEVKAGTLESKGNGSFRLMQVDTDLVQIAGGKCYDASLTWDTICIPNCEGKQCGSDGCGGSCGEGCGVDETCNAEFQCVADSCTEITLNTTSEDIYASVYSSYNYYDYTFTFTPEIEDAEEELDIVFYDLATIVTSHNLAGTNYADEHGILITLWEDSDAGNIMYFQKKGTVNVTAFDPETGDATVELKNIKLEEVEVNADDYSSVPLAGGKCLSVKDTTFTYTAPAEED